MFPRRQADVFIILRMHAATDYESSDYLFDKHQVENMKSFVPLGMFFIFAHYSAHKMSNSVRIKSRDDAASPKFPFFNLLNKSDALQL